MISLIPSKLNYYSHLQALTKHFFGADGQRKLNIETFLRFQVHFSIAHTSEIDSNVLIGSARPAPGHSEDRVREAGPGVRARGNNL